MALKATVAVSQLDLDTTNPRTKPEENQTAAMRSLIAVEKEGEKIYALALDICQKGELDPGDRLYVIRSETEEGRYIVVDGNRRLTSLRLLSQSALVDRDDIGLSGSLRQRIKRLQKDYKDQWPAEVDVAIFDDRESATHFIRLRHTGENSGAGRSAWSALQVARFDRTGSWQCVEQLLADSALNLDVANQLANSQFAITNFERVASTKDFQDRFGFALGKSSFSVLDNKQRAYAALSKLASDVVSGRVHSRDEFAETKNMKAYFAEIEKAIAPSLTSQTNPSQSLAPSTPGNQILSNEPETTKSGESSTQSLNLIPSSHDGTAAKNTKPAAVAVSDATAAPALASSPVRKKRDSKYLIDKKDLLTVTNAKCREIVNELKGQVPVADAPYACALLLRSLQEMTAEIYLDAIGIKHTTNKSTNIEQSANHLLGNSHSSDPANRQELAKSFKASSNTYDQLCEAAHSALTAVSPDHIRASWNNIGGGMDLLWKRIYAASLAAEKNKTHG